MHQNASTTQLIAGLAKIGIAMRAGAWGSMPLTGLTPTQAQVLAYLHARGPARMGVLAAALAVTAPTMSDSVRALEAREFVQRERAQGDGRGVRVALTEAGRRVAAEQAAWPDFMAAAVDTLAPEERAALLRTLVKLVRSLQENGRIAAARTCAGCRFFRPYAHDDAARPHHCEFAGVPFGDAALRIDCADFDPSPDPTPTWARFAGGTPAG